MPEVGPAPVPLPIAQTTSAFWHAAHGLFWNCFPFNYVPWMRVFDNVNAASLAALAKRPDLFGPTPEAERVALYQAHMASAHALDARRGAQASLSLTLVSALIYFIVRLLLFGETPDAVGGLQGAIAPFASIVGIVLCANWKGRLLGLTYDTQMLHLVMERLEETMSSKPDTYIMEIYAQLEYVLQTQNEGHSYLYEGELVIICLLQTFFWLALLYALVAMVVPGLVS